MAGTPQGPKLVLTNTQIYKFRNAVAAHFHKYCEMHGIVQKGRMPRGTMATFITDNISVTSNKNTSAIRHNSTVAQALAEFTL